MKTVLIPLDGSHFAEEVLEKGLGFLDKDDNLILVQCLDYNLLYANSAELSPQTIQELQEIEARRCQQYLDHQVKVLHESGFTVRSVVTDEGPVAGILAVARQERVDQIMLTTHGRGGLFRLFLGSVAEGVLRRAPCPVLIIPCADRAKGDPASP